MKKNNILFLRSLLLLIPCMALFLACTGCEKKVQAKPKGEITIRSVPEGAAVYLDGRLQKKTTPIKGKIPPGSYVLRLEKSGYQNYCTVFKIADGEARTVLLELQQEKADVLLRSVPSGAEVFFGNSKRGITPLVLRNLPKGIYSASLKLPGFSEKSVQWEISGPRPLLVSCELTSNVGSLKISSIPAGAMVNINGKPAGATPLSERREQGRYKVTISKKGYSNYETETEIRRGGTALVQAHLTQLPGSIRIRCRTKGASVRVNGRDYGNDPDKLKGLQPGTYRIEVSKPGFDTAAREVRLEADQHLDLDFSLDSNTGGIDVITTPPGVSLYLNGKAVGATERDPNQPEYSKVFQIRNLAIGKYELVLAHKRAKPNRMKKTVKVEKGRITRLNNISMWVANAVILLKDGNRTIRGKLISDAGKENIVFQPEPGITYTYKRSDLVSLQKIKEEE